MLRIQKLVTQCIVVLTLIFTSACTYLVGNNTSEPIPQIANLEVSVFATRSGLLTQEYERYVLKEKLLFTECGTLDTASATAKSSEITSALQIGRFQARRNSVDTHNLTEKEYRKLLGKIQNLRESLEANTQGKADGTTSGEGLFELVLRDGRTEPVVIIQSFDAMQDNPTAEVRKYRAIYKLLRSYAKESCGKTPFFGIS